ncbi:hypothetical protein IQ07DRAFT_381562 [Pyrenochaeta sp. DS3sAY3a]|nr:hypothetical protein IQ07DRAFT_381562 [Pyrenochaeta sp. DS3sAY3a]
MRFSLIFAAALAASADAAVFEKRQRRGPDVSDCGLDAFEGHTSEAYLFCSSILKSGTATETVTRGVTTTTTVSRRTTITVYPTSSARPTPTPSPTPTPTPTPTPKPTPTPTPTPKPSSSPSPKPSSSSPPPKPSSPKPSSTPSPTPVVPSSTLVVSPSPTPTPDAGCGIVAYVKTTAAYYFESSGTKNTFAACQALCKADAKCKSFGYGEANCMLFDVNAADNTNYNPSSPYTFYDVTCPKELPVRKRQLGISLGLPDGINISLGLGSPREISSACSCLITKGPGETTVTRTATSAVVRTTTTTATLIRTAVPTDDWVAAE